MQGAKYSLVSRLLLFLLLYLASLYIGAFAYTSSHRRLRLLFFPPPPFSSFHFFLLDLVPLISGIPSSFTYLLFII